MIEHEAEIYSKPRRTWFQTEKEKRKLAEVHTVLRAFTASRIVLLILLSLCSELHSHVGRSDRRQGMAGRKRRRKAMEGHLCARGDSCCAARAQAVKAAAGVNGAAEDGAGVGDAPPMRAKERKIQEKRRAREQAEKEVRDVLHALPCATWCQAYMGLGTLGGTGQKDVEEAYKRRKRTRVVCVARDPGSLVCACPPVQLMLRSCYHGRSCFLSILYPCAPVLTCAVGALPCVPLCSRVSPWVLRSCYRGRSGGSWRRQGRQRKRGSSGWAQSR